MLKTKLFALALLIALPLACSSEPEDGSTNLTRDAGSTVTDAGSNDTSDAGHHNQPDGGSTDTTDAGSNDAPDGGTTTEVTGALYRVFNVDLQTLSVSKGENPQTDAVPEFSNIGKLTLTDGPRDGYVEIPLGATLYAWVGLPQPQTFKVPQDAVAGSRYTAVATLSGLRLLAEGEPAAQGGRLVNLATRRDQVAVKSENGLTTYGTLSEANGVVSFELAPEEEGFFAGLFHVSSARIPEDGSATFVLHNNGLYLLASPGTQEPISGDIRMSFASLSFKLTNGMEATLTATTPVGDVTVGQAGYQVSSGAPKWVPLPITELTAASTGGSVSMTFTEETLWDTELPTFIALSDKQGNPRLTLLSNSSSDVNAGGQNLLTIVNLTDNPLRYGAPFTGASNGIAWYPEQLSGQPIRMVDSGGLTSANTTADGDFNMHVSVNADNVSDVSIPITGIGDRHLVLNYASSAGKYAFARVKQDGSLVLTSAP